MSATLRAAVDADYPALAELNNLAYPREVVSADELRYDDATVRPPQRMLRLVAIVGGELRGTAWCAQFPGSYHPGRYYLDIQVHPDHRRRGLGSQLYGALLTRLFPFDPEQLQIAVREDDGILSHVLGLGYVERMCEWQAYVEPSTVDLEPYRDRICRLAADGVEILSFAALARDTDRDQRFYDLYRQVRHDIPRTTPATDMSYDHFRRHNLDSPFFYPEGTFVAVANGSYIGLSQMWRSSVNDELFIGTTGVLRDWRRRGIALAMKVVATEFATETGCPKITTTNATSNVGMIAINDRLGYVRDGAWIELDLDLKGTR
jgi:GNAT superfamily N-acetyltransferase